MYVQGLKFSSPGLFVDDFLLATQIQVLAQAWRNLLCSPWKITFGLLVFCIFFCCSCFVMTVRSLQFPFVTCWLKKLCQTLPTFHIIRCNSSVFIISRKPTNFAVYCGIFFAYFISDKNRWVLFRDQLYVFWDCLYSGSVFDSMCFSPFFRPVITRSKSFPRFNPGEFSVWNISLVPVTPRNFLFDIGVR